MINNYTSWLNESVDYRNLQSPLVKFDRKDRITGGDEFDYFFLIASYLDSSNASHGDVEIDFDNYYDSDIYIWLTHSKRIELAKDFITTDYDWQYFKGFLDISKTEDVGRIVLQDNDQAYLDKLEKDGWEIVEDDVFGQNDESQEYKALLKKLDPLTDSEKKERSSHLVEFLRKHEKHLSKESYLKLSELLEPIDLHKIRGTVTGKKFGI